MDYNIDNDTFLIWNFHFEYGRDHVPRRLKEVYLFNYSFTYRSNVIGDIPVFLCIFTSPVWPLYSSTMFSFYPGVWSVPFVVFMLQPGWLTFQYV